MGAAPPPPACVAWPYPNPYLHIKLKSLRENGCNIRGELTRRDPLVLATARTAERRAAPGSRTESRPVFTAAAAAVVVVVKRVHVEGR